MNVFRMTAQLTDEPQTVIVSHENLEYEFEKIDASTVRYRFANETRPDSDSDRDTRVEREDVPQAVVDTLHANGYNHE